MKILSLFDGISAGQVALQRLGVDVERYYASEIDSHAMKVTQKNFPDTVHLGDVKNWKEWDINFSQIDILFGGFPCQNYSVAGKQTGTQGESGSLVFYLAEIFKECKRLNPNLIFLFENVKMKKAFLNEVNELLGVKPTLINSALVSAQSRERYYWTNLGENIVLPKDKGVKLKDILESGLSDRDKSFCLDASYYKGGNLEQYCKKSRRQLVFEEVKSAIQDGRKLNAVQKDSLLDLKINSIFYVQPSKKTEGCIRVGGVSTKNEQPRKFGQGQRVYSIEGKSVTLSAVGGGLGGKTGLYRIDLPDGEYYIRKLSAIECERLQTFDDNYTEGISKTQRLKSIGNSWTVDVIVHILKQLLR